MLRNSTALIPAGTALSFQVVGVIERLAGYDVGVACGMWVAASSLWALAFLVQTLRLMRHDRETRLRALAGERT